MKKKNVFVLLFTTSILFLFTSCVSDWFGVTGKGNMVTESRTAIDFQSVQLLTSANVTIVKDTMFKIEVEDYENIVKYISAKVVLKNLVISIDPVSTILLKSEAKVRVTMPDSLIGLTVAGSGHIDVDSSFKDIKTLLITGSGDINLNKAGNLSKLTATITGSGNMNAKGNVITLTALTSGSGNMNFEDLVAEDATCTISGSGNMYVNVTKTLKATIPGSGKIEYSGNPTVTENITGSGSVVKK
ncbi:MAG TPA: head GIN domain-containing protein [Paludibacter sp.]